MQRARKQVSWIKTDLKTQNLNEDSAKEVQLLLKQIIRRLFHGFYITEKAIILNCEAKQ